MYDPDMSIQPPARLKLFVAVWAGFHMSSTYADCVIVLRKEWETFREHYLGAYSLDAQQRGREKVGWL
jgi:hypothetical protein